MDTVLSGIRSTGHLHLGNYFGALRNFVRIQEQYRCFFFIADLHSLTTHPHPSDFHASVKTILAEYLASGLDPESAQNVNRMIRSLARQEDIAVFLCTHQLRYAQEICTRYGLIDEGRLVAAGNLEELRSRAFAESRVRIRAGNWKDEENIRKCRDKEAAENPGKNNGIGTYSVPVSSAEEIPAIVRRMVQAGADIYEVEEEIPSLEEVYFALTTGEDGIRKTDGRREQNE